MPTMDLAYVLIVNWNGWRDTIECLESVLRSEYAPYRAIVCDNDSRDGSLDRIKAWAAGELEAPASDRAELRRLVRPPVSKPVAWVEHDRAGAEAGGGAHDDRARLVLVRTGGNLGFAGGNNVGIRYALARADFEWVWLLNNDTVVQPQALGRLVARLRSRPDAGMCGSKIPYYDRPEILWALGGATYRPWTAEPRTLACREADRAVADAGSLERSMAYVAGASMLVSRPFLRDVGPMCEDYFLYFEELDWALRSRGRYRLALAADSVVYHKVGRSTALADETRRAGHGSDYYTFVNKLRITRRFFPWALPVVVPRVSIELVAGRVGAAARRAWLGLRRRSRREP
jgi:GT2 family glycosyltransferase